MAEGEKRKTTHYIETVNEWINRRVELWKPKEGKVLRPSLWTRCEPPRFGYKTLLKSFQRAQCSSWTGGYLQCKWKGRTSNNNSCQSLEVQSEIVAKHTNSPVQTFGFLHNREKIVGCTYLLIGRMLERNLWMQVTRRESQEPLLHRCFNWMVKNDSSIKQHSIPTWISNLLVWAHTN